MRLMNVILIVSLVFTVQCNKKKEKTPGDAPKPGQPTTAPAGTAPAVTAPVGAAPVAKAIVPPPELAPLAPLSATPITVKPPALPKLATIKVDEGKLTKEKVEISSWEYNLKGGLTKANLEEIKKDGKLAEKKVKLEGEKVTNADLASLVGIKDEIRQLELNGTKGITDLAPIAHLANLESLTIQSMGPLKDLTPLSYLTKLKKLDIYEMATGNLDWAASLKELEEATLRSTWDDIGKIKDAKGLAGAVKLRKLDLSCKDLSDVSFLANLPLLEDLKLWVDAGDMTGLVASKATLKKLYLYACPVEDLTPVAHLSELTFLDIYMTPATKAPMLGHLKKLKKFSASLSKLRDIGFIRYWPRLTEASFWSVKPDSWEGLQSLTELEDLKLEDTNLKDLSYLMTLTNLEQLDISNLPDLKDLRAIAGLTKLTHLSVNKSPNLEYLEPLKGLTEMKYLYLDGAAITTLAPLTGMKKLNTLHINNCEKLTSFDGISNLPELNSLSFRGTKAMKSYDVLKQFPKLKYIMIIKGQLPAALVEELKKKEVNVSEYDN